MIPELVEDGAVGLASVALAHIADEACEALVLAFVKVEGGKPAAVHHPFFANEVVAAIGYKAVERPVHHAAGILLVHMLQRVNDANHAAMVGIQCRHADAHIFRPRELDHNFIRPADPPNITTKKLPE